MWGSNKHFCATLAAGSLLACSLSASADLYRWTDDDGTVHYGDRVPPEHSKRDREVVSPHGITLRRIEGVKSAEQRAEEEALAEQRAREQSARERRARRDRIIRDSYTSEQDIIDARDTRLQAIQGLLDIANERVTVLAHRLEELEQRRDERLANDQEISENLEAQIEVTREGLITNRDFIEAREEELEETRQGYERDLERFRELREKGRI